MSDNPVAKREEEILSFWNEREIFKKTLEKDAPRGNYSFYDGPPFATGLPHYGHLLQSFVKDAVPRYQTMRGYRVQRRWGWDCHGLPIENIVEKELGISGKADIEKIGIKKFNDTCREKIFTYAKEWERIIPRVGRFVDMGDAYKTMDTSYMESEWWAFKELYDKGLVYESYRSMHVCPRCETTLSQGEVSEGYEEIKDLSATVKFELVDEPGTYLIAWTTTPWSLPGNTALAVGKDIEYVKVKKFTGKWDKKNEPTYEYIILSKEIYNKKQEGNIRLMREFPSVYQVPDGCAVPHVPKVVDEFGGLNIVGKQYKPLFDTYAQDESLENRENGWKVYVGDFVTTDTGTGIVHIAPAFGSDDMALGKEYNLPFIQHVSMGGIMDARVDMGEFSELDLKPRAKNKPDEIREIDLAIVKHLKEKELLFASEKYVHSYPHCWRCDTALLNYATSSWFVGVEKMKATLLKTAEAINWSPAHIKEGRFGKWLEGARDWSISRQRYWANTMPVWRCDTCTHEKVFGSIDELEAASGVRVDDLHKDVVDQVTFACKKDDCGGVMKRIPDVFDTWFNSGSVPYASMHYPFDNKEAFKERFPADFIGEAQDQTRAWFYYQHVLAGGLFESHAFKNCIVTGIVLAEDGKKMAKKLQNYPDPMDVVDKYGADAMRMYILSSPVMRAESLNFSEKDLQEIERKMIGRLVNVYEFYALYKDSIEHDARADSTHVLDRWIVSRMQQLHKEVTDAMEGYEIDRAARPIGDFVDDLSTWYIRRSRDRFKGKDEEDKVAALNTLRWVLKEYAKVAAPFAPFIADWLWQKVKTEGAVESVHLAEWSDVMKFDEHVIKDMAQVRELISQALEVRAKEGIKVRQPLEEICFEDDPGFGVQYDELIRDELNLKQVRRNVTITPSVLTLRVVIPGVTINTEITPSLQKEGYVRELLRAVQGLRKKTGLEPGEMVTLRIKAPESLHDLIEESRDELRALASVAQVIWEETLEGEEVVMGEEKAIIAF